jgi:hypothetical protein
MRRAVTYVAGAVLTLGTALVALPQIAGATPTRVEWESGTGGCNGTGSGWQSAVGGSGGTNCQNSVGWTTKTIKTLSLESGADVTVYGWKWSSGSPNGRYRLDTGTTVNWTAYNTPDAVTNAPLFTVTIPAGSHTLEVWSETVHYMVLDYYEIAGPPPIGEGNLTAEYPNYDCARSLERDQDGWIVRVNADEVSPWEAYGKGDPEGAPYGSGDTFDWYVEWLDPAETPLRTDPAYLGPYSWRLDESEPPVDVANGYELYLEVKRTAAAGYGFKRPIPKLPDSDEDAYVVTQVGDHEVAVGYCPLRVNLDDPQDGASGGTERDQTLSNPIDWGDGGSGETFGDCVPSGFGILSPAALVEGMSCVLRVAFVPTQLDEQWEDLQGVARGTALESVADMGDAVLGAPITFANAAGASSPCAGPEIDLTMLAPTMEPIHPLNACSGPEKTMADLLVLFLTISVYVGGAVTIGNMFLRAFGLQPIPFGRQTDDAV